MTSHPAAITEANAPLLVDVVEDGQVYVITLNRPERLNAITFEMMATLRGTLEAFRDDHRGRVAIVTGAGRGFCSGRDLKESAERLAAIERGEFAGSRHAQAPRSFAPTTSAPQHPRPRASPATSGILATSRCCERREAGRRSVGGTP